MRQGDYASSSSYYTAGNTAQYPPVPPPYPPAPTQFPLNPPYPSDPTPPLQQHEHQQPIPIPASLSYASAPPYSIPPSDYGTAPPPYPPQFSDHVPTAPSYAPPPVQQQPPASSYPSFESHPPYQQQYDAVPSYNPTSMPASSFNSNPSVHNSGSVQYPSQVGNLGLSYESAFDQRSYLDENLAKYGGGGYNSQFNAPNTSLNNSSFTHSRSDLSSGGGDYYMDDGVYQYSGSNNKAEPYGARGTSSKSSMWSSGGGGGGALFDDYGRAISSNGGSSSFSKGGGSGGQKIVKAVPKVEVDQDAKSGVQKFRVKLLAESGGQSTTDVLCQIGLDGIRMLDPSTSRTLRIYPLETITRCDGADSSIFTFWSKSSVDIEPRRIRLQSNKYTTNTILDIVTAATVQIKEMGPRSRPADFTKAAEQPTEKKKGFGDWMNIIKPANEEKDHWVPDEAVSKCTACGSDFGAFVRRHHCRNCGDIFCDKCTHGRIALTAEENAQPVRVCDRCMAEVTQRLSNAKEAASKPAGLQTHEDLARKLQEEMERNRRTTSGSKSDSSGRRMKEVACPTCTVHLQVQVPSSGSETIECGVCQHPFLVSAH